MQSNHWFTALGCLLLAAVPAPAQIVEGVMVVTQD
jgi:hypothetical protein